MTTMTPVDILDNWMAGVNVGDIEGLLALYSENAVLIPTFSSRLLRTPENIREYFVKLTSRDDLSVALHQKTHAVQAIQDRIFTSSGIYCWRFAIDEQLLTFEARFTYVFDLALDRPIIHHHSSQIPRML
jgi:hypothetical protein